MRTMNQSLTEENYLKAIYRLSQERKGKISLTAIADMLKVNAASVVEMIKKLAERKLISYEKTKGVRLTEKGVRIALSIVRNHRLWEAFLFQKLRYTWDAVHEIAEQLEHVKHPELADRLDQFLGHPVYDPHGDPIPESNGQIPHTFGTILLKIDSGRSCQGVGVKDTSPAFLQYLQQLHIGIGTKIKVLERIAFDGSIIIHVGKAEKKSVSRLFAESVLVNER